MNAHVVMGLLVGYGAVAFGWRSWLQWKRTGSAGFRGIAGRRAPPVEWLGGALLVVAFLLTAAAPVLVATGAARAWSSSPLIVAAGAALMAAGFLTTVTSQLAMGDSWRIGVDSRERTALVVQGPFRWVRNPIFTSMLLFVAGAFVALPHAVSLSAFLCALAGIEIQVRAVEEPYLLRAHGPDYEDYRRRVGRFLPGIGRSAAR